MDQPLFDEATQPLADATDRRNALRSLGAAGVGLLAALGLAEVGEAKEGKDGRRKGRNHKAKRNQRASGRNAPVSAQVGPPDGLPAPLQGPTGPTGPTGPAGADSQVAGPTGPTGAAGSPGTITEAVGERVSVLFGERKTGRATCPAGSVAVGGGYLSEVGAPPNLGCFAESSFRFPETTWEVTIRCPPDNTTSFVVQAICLTR
jgi:hypothetical protein